MTHPETPNPAERSSAPMPPGSPPVPGAWGKPRSKPVTWYDPAVTAAGADGLSGLEFITALAEGRIAPPPIASLLNMWPVKVERGLVVFECVPDESVYNPIGVVHGGLLCALADSVAGCAVHTTLAAGTGYTSVDIAVNYLRPVTVDSGPLTATGRVIKPGRRIALASAEVTDGAGRLVSTATSNCLIIP
ncbi:MAG: PaaI family thioesterase [Streptosporangiaceae bacterium]